MTQANAARHERTAQLYQLTMLGTEPEPVRDLATDPEIEALIERGAPVAIGVSGGIDSCAVAIAVVAYLKTRNHRGPVILIHADLGEIEWKDSIRTCRRLAQLLNVELIVVRRKRGSMVARWVQRKRDNERRYAEMRCVKVIGPWSSAKWRFCTAELKLAPIFQELTRRFPGQTIISVSGLRRNESGTRENTPVAQLQDGLHRAAPRDRSHGETNGYSWNPLVLWRKNDAFDYVEKENGFTSHEAYWRFMSPRVSCTYCVLGSHASFTAAIACEETHDVYRTLAQIEIESTFSFQPNGKWLGDFAPHLLGGEQGEALAATKQKAARRERAEARIPGHLLYEHGWPKVIPTPQEAQLLCEVRREVAEALGLQINYTDPNALVARYEELMAANLARQARNRKKGAAAPETAPPPPPARPPKKAHKRKRDRLDALELFPLEPQEDSSLPLEA